MLNHMSDDNKKNISVYGMPLPFFLLVAVIILTATYFDVVPVNMPGAIGVLLIFGAIFGVVGDKIPVWNEYIGGGPILCFLVGAVMVYLDILPPKTAESIVMFFDEFAFIDLFVTVLITGSILSVNRKLLIKALRGYFPAILGGVALSFLVGGGVGMLFGKSFLEVIAMYALPIMGGGTGAGAIPMSEIYSNITGDTPQNFLSFALPILTIANIISIIFGAMSHKLGQAKPEWTGEGELVRRGSFQEVSYEEKGHVENKEIKPTLADVGAALAFGTSIYLLGRVFSSVLLPTIFGIQIHAFAYMVLFMAVFNMTNIVPENIKAGAKRLMKFFTGQLMFLQMFAVGVAFGDFEGLVSALTIPNLIICFAVVVGAYVGSALVGYLVGFYPIESAISAGLCMANRGGSGDIAVLGAAKRMNLMSFAQISSRLGGGIMLFIASVVFSFF